MEKFNNMQNLVDRNLPWLLVFVLVGIAAWQQNVTRSDQNARFDQLREMHAELVDAIEPIQQQLMTHGVVVPLQPD
jgi:hypothetical protein